MATAALSPSDRRLLMINLDLSRAAIAGAAAAWGPAAERRSGFERSLEFATKAAEAAAAASTGPQRAGGGGDPISPELTAEYNRRARGSLGDIVARPMNDEEKSAVLGARAHYARGAALMQLDRTAEAAAANDQATLLAARLPRDTLEWLKAVISDQRATLQAGRGQYALAEATLIDARKNLRRTAAQSRLEAFLLRHLADVQRRQGKTADAKRSQSESFDILVQQSDGSPPTRDDVASYLSLLAPAAVAGDPDDVARFFAAASVAIETETAGAVAEVAARFASDDNATGAAIRTLQARRRALGEAEGKLARVADSNADAQQLRDAESAVLRAREQVAAAEAEAQRVGGTRAGAILSPKTDLSQLQAALGADEAYIRFIFLDEGGYALMATPGSARVVKLTLNEAQARQITDDLRASARLVRLPDGGQALPQYRTTRSHELYRALFGDLRLNLQSTRRLVVEPAGPLFSVPFAALLTEPLTPEGTARLNASGGIDYSGAAWLGRRASVELSVGAASFVRLRAATRRSEGRPLLAFANPSSATDAAGEAQTVGFARSALRSSGSALDSRLTATCTTEAASLFALPALAASQTEAEAAVRAMGPGGAVVAGGAFTDKAVKDRDDLDQFRTLLFATHAGLPDRADCWPDPYLVTSRGASADSDGVLETVEIADLDLNADLVVLSACDTAAGDGRGQALGGLAQSFIFAGSRGVIVSHWAVSSSGAAALSQALFERLGRGETAAVALAGAERSLMDQAAMSHPYYWGAFTLVGGSPRA
jgi:CHAT domain-containing protein